MPGWLVLQGDARHLPLRDESVQCVVTSPPYWGLRDYGLPPLVWGGEECEHEWGTELERAHETRTNTDFNARYFGKDVSGDRKQEGGGRAGGTSGTFCLRCSAWRGSLGLEPVPDCGRPLMELRPDVTDAQRAFVHRRLQDAGLLDGGPYGNPGRASMRSPSRSGAQDVAPRPAGDVPGDSSESHSLDSAIRHGRGQPCGKPGTLGSGSPSHGLGYDRPSSSGGQAQQGESLADGDLPPGGPPKSPSGDIESTSFPAAPARSSASWPPDSERQDSLPSRDGQPRSSREPTEFLRGSHEGSAKSSGKRSNRTRGPAPSTGEHIGCSCESTAWAYYILPQDIRQFYRAMLCGACYVCHLVEIFREVWRVLRNDGVCWVNIGDGYASAWPAPNTRRNLVGNPMSGGKRGPHRQSKLGAWGLKEKDLVGMPWRLAFALQADGWWLRSDVVWSKPNPMPESVTDRPTKAHEYVFLLTKSERYYWDAEAVREESVGTNDHDLTGPGYLAPGQTPQTGSRRSKKPDGWASYPGGHGSFHRDGREAGAPAEIRHGRNLRSVWIIATEPFPEAHFATFPRKLVEMCVKAGSKEGDVVCDPFCGSGTVPAVAESLGRVGIGCDLKFSYLEMARRRASQAVLI